MLALCAVCTATAAVVASSSGMRTANNDFVGSDTNCSLFVQHLNTIGPKAEQAKRVEFQCSNSSSCPREAGIACLADPHCVTYGLNSAWKESVAQLYATHWNASYQDSGWAMYASSCDEPPAWVPPSPPSPPGSCKSNMDCSLNGECNASTGICTCYAPWKTGTSFKEACNVLDIVPHPNDYVPAYGGPNRTDTIFRNQTVTSWGGNIIKGDDGLYHLWVSRMRDGEGLNSWTHDSQIDHAVAEDPMDVFDFAEVALSAEAHNASPLRARNGSYLIFHIGSGFLHHSETPNGPWLPLPGINCNNPAPMIHSNGSFFCGCNNGDFQIYRCDDPFEARWEFVTSMQFPDAWSQPSQFMRSEDPYLWMDTRHNWHILAHRYDYRDGWPANPNQTEPVLVSGHGFSRNGIDWHFNIAEQPYNATITFENGTRQFFSTFERPHLVFDDAGEPTHLVNGVSPYWTNPGMAGACDGCVIAAVCTEIVASSRRVDVS